MLATLQSAPWVPLVLIVGIIALAIVIAIRIGFRHDERRQAAERAHELVKIEKTNAVTKIEHKTGRGGEG